MIVVELGWIYKELINRVLVAEYQKVSDTSYFTGGSR